jgi:hypothetical protein
MLRPATHHDLRRRVLQAVVALQLGRNQLAQPRDAVDRRVLRLAPAQRVGARVLDEIGRVEVRLADREVADVVALLRQLPRQAGDRQRGRGLDREDGGVERLHP